MYRPEYILLPVNPFFIAFSLLLAFMLNLLPWGHYWGVPDFVALVVVFWNIHHPRIIGIGIAFFMGLLMDVHDAALLGEHALSYTLFSYFTIMTHRRVLWFSLGMQAAHLFPLLIAAQCVQLAVRLSISGKFPGPLFFLESLTGVLLWPILTWLLLAPQRRPIDKDLNRPI